MTSDQYTTRPMSIHLPYSIDPSSNRYHYYESLWKLTALRLLSRHEPHLSGLSLLDYGCGRGETMMLAKTMGLEVCGVDLDAECVRLSSAYGRAETLNLADPVGQFGMRAFDITAAFHVLEHVSSPVITLNHLRLLSRRFVLLAVPNLRVIPDLLRPAQNVHPTNEGHLQSWDHTHLLNLAEKHCGLRLVAWGFDHVRIPILSNQLSKLFGQKFITWLETGLFLRLFPYQSTSVIGLFKVIDD